MTRVIIKRFDSLPQGKLNNEKIQTPTKRNLPILLINFSEFFLQIPSENKILNSKKTTNKFPVKPNKSLTI